MNRGPAFPGNIPSMSVGTTVLTVNRQLMTELKSYRAICLEIEDGCPVLYPDLGGYAVTPNRAGYTGMITAPAIMTVVRATLPRGSRWIMERDQRANCWRGRAVQR